MVLYFVLVTIAERMPQHVDKQSKAIAMNSTVCYFLGSSSILALCSMRYSMSIWLNHMLSA
jgi:hypothetical protein